MPTKRKDPAELMPAGRHSTYDPAYCDTVVNLGRQGKSFTQIACIMGVGRATLQRWSDDYPEFRDAITRAKEHEQCWWETAGQVGLDADRFNAAVWKKSMEARFRDNYTERKEVSGKLTISHEDALAGLE